MRISGALMMVATGWVAGCPAASTRLRKSWSVTMPIGSPAGDWTRMALDLARAMAAAALWIGVSRSQVASVSGEALMDRVASGSMLCRSATRRARVSSVFLRAATSLTERICPALSPIVTGAEASSTSAASPCLLMILARRSAAGAAGPPLATDSMILSNGTWTSSSSV